MMDALCRSVELDTRGYLSSFTLHPPHAETGSLPYARREGN